MRRAPTRRRIVLKILILGLNYAPECIGISVYTTGLAEALAAAGHQVKVIAGVPYYPQWQVFDDPECAWTQPTLENGVSIQRVRHYVPRRASGSGRLLHHLSFAASAFVPSLLAAYRFRPDMVFTVAPSLVAAPVARLAAMVSGARSWLHIQDFELDAATATALLRRGGLAERVGSAVERAVLRWFDTVSTISPQMCQRLAEKGVAPDKIVHLRNWADLAGVQPLNEPSSYRAEWNITTPHVALYSGSIGVKQGMDTLLETARCLSRREDLTFVVCGEGPGRRALEEAAAGLPRVQFHDLQPTEKLGQLLGLATVHLLPQSAEVADLMLPSKLTNMLASGRPIVATAAEGSGLWEEVQNCGLAVPPGDAVAFAGGIEALLDDASQAATAGLNGRRRAQERWSKDRIIEGFVHRLSASPVQAAPELIEGVVS